MVHQFFALTERELFCITVGELRASVVQIAEWSDTKCQRGLDMCSSKYPSIEISADYIRVCKYHDDGSVKGVSIGPSTARVVALFGKVEEARTAFSARVVGGEVPPEWDESTRRVIGSACPNQKHARFHVNKNTGLLSE